MFSQKDKNTREGPGPAHRMNDRSFWVCIVFEDTRSGKSHDNRDSRRSVNAASAREDEVKWTCAVFSGSKNNLSGLSYPKASTGVTVDFALLCGYCNGGFSLFELTGNG